MEDIYWICALGNLNIVLTIILIIVSIFAGSFLFIALITYQESNKKTIKKAIVTCSIVIIFIILYAFLPNSHQLYAIYGIGGTIDYIKSNDTAKQLPDKTIIALDKYLSELSINNIEDKK